MNLESLILNFNSPQEVAQSVRITLNKVEVTSLNLHPPSYVDMSKKIIIIINFNILIIVLKVILHLR
jgi:hypothetical protein